MDLRQFILPQKYPFGADERYDERSRYGPDATFVAYFADGKQTSKNRVLKYFQKFVVKEQVDEQSEDDIQTYAG